MALDPSPAGAEQPRLVAPVLAWVDAVGVFQLRPGRRWRIGGPGGDPPAEITICGDLSRRAAEVLRRGSRYVLHGFSAAPGGELRSDRPQELSGVQRFKLGVGIELEFAQPHPLSASATMRMVSRHRFDPAADRIVLVADTCIFGPSASSHIVCPDASQSVVLTVGEDGNWRVKATDGLKIDGRAATGMVPLSLPCRIEAGDFVMALEPLGRSTAF